VALHVFHVSSKDIPEGIKTLPDDYSSSFISQYYGVCQPQLYTSGCAAFPEDVKQIKNNIL
jgi:hypothetical protein